MYLRKVYVRFKEGHPDSTNTFAAWDGFQQMGVETAPFYGFGDIEQMTDLGPEVGLVGFVGDVQTALKRMGKPWPAPIDYPEELQEWLHRKVWRSTLGQIRRTVDPVFIKPVEEKIFMGFVWRAPGGDQLRIATCGDDVEIWVSDRVEFLSEYRVYVKDGDVLGARLYKGDWGRAPDRREVERAISAYRSAHRAYSLDFGVLANGPTALVEVNDFYALGNYGLPAPLYAQAIEARWEELTR